MTSDTFQRKLTAILSADVVGYSRLMGDDEAATVKTLETYKGVMFSLIKQHRGRVVDSPGDNLLAEFGSVVDAVQCAVSIQKELQTRNADLPENRRMEFRIGINLGDVIEEDDRIYGDGVNIAARLEALADPGGICISKTAFDYIENKLPFGYRFIGEQTVKNIAKPIGAYKVLMETRLIDEEEQKAKASFWRRKSILSIGIIVILVIVAVLYWNLYPRGASIEPEQVPVVSDVEKAPKTIAVLPFVDISPEKDQEYFVDGLSEELLNSLTKITDLRVIARTSSFLFKDSDKSIQEIAKELGADHILEGSVRKAGNSLRITAQLIRATDGIHLWSEIYDRELKDIFEVQEDIANNVADKLKLTLESLKLLGGTENIEAYELYLIAQGKRAEENIPGYKSALELLDAAIVLDPEFALAWAYKAENHLLLKIFGPYSRSIAELDAALRAAQKAIELEPNLGDGYIDLGWIKMVKREWLEAELNFRKVLEVIDESLSFDDYFIIPFYLGVGKFKRAHELLDRMRRNDPINQAFLGWYYFTYGFLGDRQRAEEEYKRRNKLLSKGYSDWHDNVITTVRLGSGDVVFRDEIVFSNPINITLKEYLDSPGEGLVELRRIYSSDDSLSAWDLNLMSIWAAYFGDSELAMETIENNDNLFSLWFPVMKKVRQLPHFKEFLREIGLVDYWNKFGWPDLCRPAGEDDFVCE
jgi:adenylate cyclase